MTDKNAAPDHWKIRETAKRSIRVCVSDFGGELRVDVRAWYLAEDGRWLPTRKGVAVHADEVGALQAALGEAAAAIASGTAMPPGTDPPNDDANPHIRIRPTR